MAVSEHVQRFDHSAGSGQGAGEAGRAGAALHGLGGEIPVPAAVPDLGGMAPPHRHGTIGGQRAGLIDAELAGDRGRDRLGYRSRV